MGKINLADYKNLYLKTAMDYVNNISSGFSKLCANIQDSEAINLIHISSHSLKSQSQVMGFADIADLCMKLEKASSDILKGTNQVNDQFIDLLKNSINGLSSKIAQIEKGDAAATLA
jgi:chemotaxis protein histidine kinase CheA